ncbi:ligase-associated DNA damage response endonuclease PdeM [Aegicerativicinus sediminis]|uniref:ligase-associated DNA damage response endonuclease PdeM n=1 Tax=Aegicerativicinus sediminis TaxID=2893202 RepID=UPI001E2D281B|nr:ligase-associated DNA damage response endonuclease PdeM [Aegicerativicinus sediminis]
MTIQYREITCQEEQLLLTNQRAVYWPRQKALILSDLHLGKAAHFRKFGIPISKKVFKDDLKKLEELIGFFQVTRLIIVGDLFHAEANTEVMDFQGWISKNPGLSIELIKGNHDQLTDRIYTLLGVKIYKDSLELSGFCFVHERPQSFTDKFTITGHTHPGVVLKGRGKQRVRLPCYQLSKSGLVLPAFSKFTGLDTRKTKENPICYAITDTSVFEV